MQVIRRYEKRHESLVMLKILALGKKEAEEGKVQAMDEAFDDLQTHLTHGQNPGSKGQA